MRLPGKHNVGHISREAKLYVMSVGVAVDRICIIIVRNGGDEIVHPQCGDGLIRGIRCLGRR
eukprot:4329379-Pyramimonas_sp.AAC.1